MCGNFLYRLLGRYRVRSGKEKKEDGEIIENGTKTTEENVEAKKADTESAGSNDAPTDIVQDSPDKDTSGVAVIAEVQSPSSQTLPVVEESKEKMEQKIESPVTEIVEAKIETTGDSCKSDGVEVIHTKVADEVKVKSDAVATDIPKTDVSVEVVAQPEASSMLEVKQAPPEEPKPVTPAAEEPKPITPAAEEPKPVTPAAEEPKPVTPAAEEPKPVMPVAEEPNPVATATEELKPITPAAEEAKPVMPAMEETKPVTPSTEELKPVTLDAEEPKTVTPDVEEAKPIIPDAEEKPIMLATEEAKPITPVTEEPTPINPPAEEPKSVAPLAEKLESPSAEETTQIIPPTEETTSVIPPTKDTITPAVEATPIEAKSESVATSPKSPIEAVQSCIETVPAQEIISPVAVEQKSELLVVENISEETKSPEVAVPVSPKQPELPAEAKSADLVEAVTEKEDTLKSETIQNTVDSPLKENGTIEEKQTTIFNGSLNGDVEQNEIMNETPNVQEQNGPADATTLVWKNGGNNVAISGDFNQWEDNHILQKQDDVFLTKIKLTKGTHHLKYIVDGVETVDDSQPIVELDGHGQVNVLTVE